MTDGPTIDGRKLRYQGRRGELLDAAAEYVLGHGIATLSFRPMAKALGVSPSVLVNHFQTKEGLITEVLGLLGERMASQLPTGEQDDPLSGYADWWHRWTTDESLPILRLAIEVVGLAVQSPDRFESFRANAVTGWIAVVRSQLRAAGCPADELETTATSLVAHTTGLQVDLLLTGDRVRVDAAHDAFVAELDERRRTWEPPQTQ